MANTYKNTNNGVGFVGLLQLALLLGKIFEIAPVASWSWWWIWSPVLIVLAILSIIMSLAFWLLK